MTVWRLLSGVLGVMWIALGMLLFFASRDGIWRRLVVALGFVVWGWYFVGYAVTARTAVWWPRFLRQKPAE